MALSKVGALRELAKRGSVSDDQRTVNHWVDKVYRNHENLYLTLLNHFLEYLVLFGCLSHSCWNCLCNWIVQSCEFGLMLDGVVTSKIVLSKFSE